MFFDLILLIIPSSKDRHFSLILYCVRVNMADSWFQVVLEGFQRQTQAILAAFAVLFVTNTSLSSVYRTWLAPANVCKVTSYTNRERILHDCEKIRILCSRVKSNILQVSPANDSLRAGSLVWTGSRNRELFLALPTLFLASSVLDTQTSEPARRLSERVRYRSFHENIKFLSSS